MPTDSTSEPSPWADEAALLGRLQRQDEAAYAEVVAAFTPGLARVARTIVSTDASAAEVVQDTWLAVARSVDGFEGRSSLKTWVFRILVNTARRRAARESRSVPWSSLGPDEAAVDPVAFQDADEPYPGHWRAFPEPWPETALLAHEVRDVVARLVAELPPQQRAVITLRDVEGWGSAEAAEALDLSEGNQRVLLHRARARVRRGVVTYLAGDRSGVTPGSRADSESP